MPTRTAYASIPAIVRRMAAAIGIAVAVLVPLSFGLTAYLNLIADTQKGARLSADRLAQYAFVQGDTWRFSGHRISELIGGLAESIAMPRQIVETADGRPVVEIGKPLTGAFVSRSWPIVARGDTVGVVRVESSLSRFFALSGLLAVLGIGLGGSIYLIAHRLPLNALRNVVAELERTEAALAASYTRMSEAIESLPDGFALFDAEDRIALFNRRFLDAAGLQADDAPSRKTFEQILRLGAGRGHYAAVGADAQAWIAERTRQHRVFDDVVEQLLSDGRHFRIVERSTADGGRVGVWTDVTPLKRSEADRAALQEQFHQAQKQEAVGKLTGGMAHDFNNYLGIIIGNLDLLSRHVAPAGVPLLEAAVKGAESSAQLTRSLLAFSRQQPLSPRRVDIGLNLYAVATLLRRTLGEDIVLTAAVEPETWPVRVDSSQLDSCIVNLANNARDAMPHGGSLTISARNLHLDAGAATKIDGAEPGDYVAIEVSDSGAGMPPEVLSQAFEPFFSTKPPGHGTGLGLSMVYGFVRQSGGWIDIVSEVGVGTTVRIGLPPEYGADRSGSADPTSGQGANAGKDEVILVVDDSAMLRETVVEQLTSLGYRTLEAADGAAALALLQQRDRRIDLLFTDVVMPGKMDGYELARQALELRPGIKTLLTSGYPGARENAGHGADIDLLAKPYRLAALARAIRTALAA